MGDDRKVGDSVHTNGSVISLKCLRHQSFVSVSAAHRQGHAGHVPTRSRSCRSPNFGANIIISHLPCSHAASSGPNNCLLALLRRGRRDGDRRLRQNQKQDGYRARSALVVTL